MCVPQDSVAIVEKFGKFHKSAKPGCFCIGCPGVFVVRSLVSMRVQQKIVEVLFRRFV